MDRDSPTEPPHLRARCGETNWTRSLTATPHAAAPPPPPLAPAPALDQPSTAPSRPPRELPAARAARGSMKPSPVPRLDGGSDATSTDRTNSANGDTRDDPPVSESEESSSSCSEWATVEDSALLCWVHTGTGPYEGWELRQSRPQTSDDAALVSPTSAALAARVASPRASEPPVPVIAELSAASDEEEEEAHKTEARLTLEDGFKAFQEVHSEGRDEVLYWCTLKQIQLILERIDLKELSDGAAATHRIGIRADVDGRAVTLSTRALAAATQSRKRTRCYACENCRKKRKGWACLNPPGA